MKLTVVLVTLLATSSALALEEYFSKSYILKKDKYITKLFVQCFKRSVGYKCKGEMLFIGKREKNVCYISSLNFETQSEEGSNNYLAKRVGQKYFIVKSKNKKIFFELDNDQAIQYDDNKIKDKFKAIHRSGHFSFGFFCDAVETISYDGFEK